MAKKAIAQIEIGESTTITRYERIVIFQPLFGHHEFEIQLPLEVIEGQGNNTFNKSKDLIGKIARISFESEQFARLKGQLFVGIVTDLSIVRFEGTSNHLVIKGKSVTILMDDGYQCRSFSEKNLSDIVNEVTVDYPQNMLTVNVAPEFGDAIPYVVQYRESNFQFLHRIANHYAEWIYYDGSEMIFGKPAEEEATPLKLGNNLMSFNLGMELAPINFQLHAYDYIKNEVLESTASDANISNIDPAYGEVAFKESETVFSQSPLTTAIVPIADKSQLDQLVKWKRDQQSSNMVKIKGRSDHIEVGIGKSITVSGSKSENPIDGLEDYGEFIVTKITHRIQGNGDYENQFTAVPKEVGVPPLNPKVRMPLTEPQPAVVVENHDPDALGRVRVRLYWQKSPEMTPWIRLMSSHGGATGGFFVVPEVDDEVMVGFEYNYPSRPFVMGSLYHGKAKPGGGWQDKDNNIKAIKTKSGNEIILNDTPGEEGIQIINGGGKNSMNFSAANGGNISMSSSNTTDMSSTNDMTVGGKNITINASDDVTINCKNLIVNASVDINLTASANINTAASADTSITSSANTSISSGANTSVSSGADTEISSRANTKVGGDANVEAIAGANFKAVGNGNAEVLASGELNLASDGNATLSGNAAANVKSPGAVNVEAAGVTAVTGSVIKLN